MFLYIAVLAAIEAKAGFGGYVMASTIGLLLTVGNYWTLNKVFDVFYARVFPNSESLREWCFRAFLLAMFLWIFGAGILGMWLTLSALRLLARG